MALREIAQENLSIYDAGGYELDGQWVDFAARLKASVEGSTYHLSRCSASAGDAPTVPLVHFQASGSLEAAEAPCRTGRKVCVLNFASARRPGGGFLTGARAQEEELCRASALYPTLLQHPDFYHNPPKAFYTDKMIYSPQVPVFRTRDGLMKEPFYVDVVTAAAVNMTQVLHSEQNLVEPTMLRRMAKLLALCQEKGAETLVLGAWGTGVFGLDVRSVAQWFQMSLKSASIPEVMFAIPEEFKCGQFQAAFEGSCQSSGAGYASPHQLQQHQGKKRWRNRKDAHWRKSQNFEEEA
mmetsp:Transcript_105683/g.187938  ORF Transcript_105683/g.187938 Transcript_105683/m.187938 type:complete len:296 (-) Transcript_105683:317-1204(-)|eukprot:CAMPEP_0197636024 /NCGR_PEP_ID=MMETSP1338-20131121/11663_1 /TAXON_ID=43686 ORGANISM="Pelagodinium beii, Strain RCC1491" /NCGR_SAMPLE_ID=MMETSP1338 /ASSEMBLY_ACC=CAM_ASM_000754 /LENGTH=295 /DNA_ID=CAMNT_0043208183 /DNA_START=81 /DNA_END=968 /DNA_ORIENTATION=-